MPAARLGDERRSLDQGTGPGSPRARRTGHSSKLRRVTRRSTAERRGPMSVQTSQLLRPDDLADAGKTSGLAQGDLDALLAVSRWIDEFVVRPHADLGRAGTVCPFVPGS